jgi:hypothetical protein
MTDLKVLDLFCGQGGATAGYLQAGFSYAMGIDSDELQLNRYFGTWKVLGDWRQNLEALAWDADFIHASPPCQRHSKMQPHKMTKARWGDATEISVEHEDYIGECREALKKIGKPFVIENVVGSPLENPILLCGCMFGLTVNITSRRRTAKSYVTESKRALKACVKYKCNDPSVGIQSYPDDKPFVVRFTRERLFEAYGFELTPKQHDIEFHSRYPNISIVNGSDTDTFHLLGHHDPTRREKLEALQVPWMDLHGVAESIPPAYARYVGTQFLESRRAA